ncbi:MAG: TPM domain-containing protein [Microcoleus sp.]
MQLQSRHKQIIWVSLLSLSALTFPLASEAITVREVPNPRQVDGGWVTDKANILSDSTENRLDRIISDLEAKNGSEIAVVTVTETKPSVTPKAFATELFNYWGIGKKGKNNGVLLLISAGERRIEIETGSGIQGILPDSQVLEIINSEIKPRFQKQDFNGGTLAGTKALVNILDNSTVTPQAIKPLPLAPTVPHQGDKNLPTATPSPVINNSTSTEVNSANNSSSAIDSLLTWFIITPIAIFLIFGCLGLFIAFMLVSAIVKKIRSLFSGQSPVPSSRHYQGNYSGGNSTRNNHNYSVNNHNYWVGGENYSSSDCDGDNYSSSDDCGSEYNSSSSDYSSSSDDCGGEYSSNSSDSGSNFGGGESAGGGAGSDYSSSDYSSSNSSDSSSSFGGGESTGGGAGSDYSSSSSSSDYSSSSSSSDYSSSSSSDCSGGGGSW